MKKRKGLAIVLALCVAVCGFSALGFSASAENAQSVNPADWFTVTDGAGNVKAANVDFVTADLRSQESNGYVVRYSTDTALLAEGHIHASWAGKPIPAQGQSVDVTQEYNENATYTPLTADHGLAVHGSRFAGGVYVEGKTTNASHETEITDIVLNSPVYLGDNTANDTLLEFGYINNGNNKFTYRKFGNEWGGIIGARDFDIMEVTVYNAYDESEYFSMLFSPQATFWQQWNSMSVTARTSGQQEYVGWKQMNFSNMMASRQNKEIFIKYDHANHTLTVGNVSCQDQHDGSSIVNWGTNEAPVQALSLANMPKFDWAKVKVRLTKDFADNEVNFKDSHNVGCRIQNLNDFKRTNSTTANEWGDNYLAGKYGQNNYCTDNPAGVLFTNIDGQSLAFDGGTLVAARSKYNDDAYTARSNYAGTYKGEIISEDDTIRAQGIGDGTASWGGAPWQEIDFVHVRNYPVKLVYEGASLASTAAVKHVAASAGKAFNGAETEILPLKSYTPLGLSDDIEGTKTYTVTATNATLQGLSSDGSGTWREGATFTPNAVGAVTITYTKGGESIQVSYNAIELFDYTNITGVNDANADFTITGGTMEPQAVTSGEPYGDYNGYKFTATERGATITYKHDIALADLTENNRLLDLLPMPQQQGAEDMNKVKVTLADKNGNKMIFVMNAGEVGKTCVMATAESKNGDVFSWVSEDRWDGGLNYAVGETEIYGAQLGCGFRGHTSGGSIYYQPISIRYDHMQKSLYGAPYANWGNSAGLIRDFTKKESELTGGNGVVADNSNAVAGAGDKVWNGFETDVTLSVTVQDVNRPSSFLITSIAGKSLARPSGTRVIAKGIAGTNYPFPAVGEPYSPSRGASVEKVYSTVKVYNAEAQEVTSDVTADGFTPSAAGTYTLKYYTADVGADNVSRTYLTEVQVEVAASGDSMPLSLTDVDIQDERGNSQGNLREFVGTQKFKFVGAASSDLYLQPEQDSPALSVSVQKASDTATMHAVGETITFAPGVYTVKIIATDYVGRTAEETISLTVHVNSLRLKNGIAAEARADRDDTIAISTNDVELWDEDIHEAGGAYNATIQITAKKDNSAISNFDAETYVFEVGEYEITYTAIYTVGSDSRSISAVRKITVTDTKPPVITLSALPEGVYLLPNSALTDDLIYAVVLTADSKEICLNGVSAHDPRKGESKDDITEHLKVTLDADNAIDYNATNGYVLTVQEGNTYYVKFTVSDGVNSTQKTVAVQATTDYFTAVLTGDATREIGAGETFVLDSWYKVQNIDGSAVAGATVAYAYRYAGGEETAIDGAFAPKKVGEYELIARVQKDGQHAEARLTLTVTDKSAPTVIIGEYSSTGDRNMYYDLPSITVSDDSDTVSYRVYIQYEDEERKELTDDKVLFEKSGDVQIIVEATDGSGKTTAESITIAVSGTDAPFAGEQNPQDKGCGCGSVTGANAIGLAVIGLAVVSILLLAHRRAKHE